MTATVAEDYTAASIALVTETERLADVGTPLPSCGNGDSSFRYTRDLLDWVLDRPVVGETDRARLCFDALCTLGIAYAVPATDTWMRAKWAWEKEYHDVQEAIERETV